VWGAVMCVYKHTEERLLRNCTQCLHHRHVMETILKPTFVYRMPSPEMWRRVRLVAEECVAYIFSLEKFYSTDLLKRVLSYCDSVSH
jgi:hypothetical protein